MTELEKSYIAGMLDADGWMSLHDNGYTVTFNIGIVNAHQETLEWIRCGFGGRVRAHSRPKSRIGENWRPTWSYLPDSQCVESFVRAIRPYLRIKIRQADILLEFLDTRGRGVRTNTYRTPPEIVQRRNVLLREIRELNQPGKILKLDFSSDRKPKDPNKQRVRRWWKKPIDVQPEIAATATIASDLTEDRQS